MSRVGSFNAHTEIMQNSMRLQHDLFRLQVQQSSSLKVEGYDELVGDTQLIQNSRNAMIKIEAYIKASKHKLPEIESKHNALKQISDLLIRAKSTAGSALGASTDEKKFQAINHAAKLMLSDLESLLNTKYDDVYLFGGSLNDKAPVKIFHASFVAQKSPSSADFGYYSGDDKSSFLTVREDHVLQDSINAGSEGIEKAIRAIAMLSEVQNTDRKTAKEAFNLLKKSIASVSRELTKTSQFSKSVKENLQINEKMQTASEEIFTSLTKADVHKVISEITNVQVSLQASFSVISKMNHFSLLNYLR